MAIYHPYGTVGYLPWYSEANTVEFGDEPHPRDLAQLAGQIKTFTEGTDPNSSEVAEIRAKLADAQTVVFLGFAFHRMNLALLKPRKASADASYYATGIGISESNSNVIKGELVQQFGARLNKIKLERALRCSDLLPEFWRSLSDSDPR